MKKIRDFMNKYPLIYAALGLVLLWVAVRILPAFPAGAVERGVNEVRAAVIILLVYWLLSGRKQDLKPDFTGFGYGFRVMRIVFICAFVFLAMGLFSLILSFKTGAGTEGMGGRLLNVLLLALAVGAVEEFTCRAMLFGGLVRVFKGTRRGVIWAAVISGALFGFVHVAQETFTGQITNTLGVLQVIGKTLQTGIFGFVLAIIYFRNRSIWSVAALHSLFDATLLIGSTNSGTALNSYVRADASLGKLSAAVYFILSLIMIPIVIRCLRELKKEPEPYCCPGDEDFAPRKLTYEKNGK